MEWKVLLSVSMPVLMDRVQLCQYCRAITSRKFTFNLILRVREHQQKTFVMLKIFWLLRGWGVRSNPLKKENLWWKYFFQVMLNEVLKICEKMISAENIWWLYLRNFYKKYLQNLKQNVKRTCVFHLILVSILSILILFVKACVCYFLSIFYFFTKW